MNETLHPEYNLDHRLIELADIDSIEYIQHMNGVDIEVEEDHTFTLASGVISHNSAAKSVQAGRGKSSYVASFPLRGKPLNIREKELKRILENVEIKNLLTIIGLNLGVPVETVAQSDGEWIELEVNGTKIIANENDNIEVDGKWVSVSSLI